MDPAQRKALAALFRAAHRLVPAAQAWHQAVYGESAPPAAITELRAALIDPDLESLIRDAIVPRAVL